MRLLNCEKKFVKRIIAEELSCFCKTNLKLYGDKIEIQKSVFAIDATVTIVDNIHKT